MNKRIMGIILIIAGAILLICGIVMVSTNHHNAVEPSNTPSQVVVVEKHIHDTITTSSPSTTPTVVENSVSRPIDSEKSTVDESKAKGNAFEDFVVNLLADWRLKLLDRTQDAVSSAGVVAESCKNPDLHVQQKRGKSEIDYYLECKYRSQWKDGAVTFEDWQLDRYRQFQRNKHRKVLFALGVGGTPSAPAVFMLVPLDSVKSNSIKKIRTEFAIDPSSSALVAYMNNYFTKVFSKSKQKSN